MSNTKPRIEFTKAQIQYLNNQFPEMIGNHTTSTEELRWRSAQRSVIHFIATRESKQIG